MRRSLELLRQEFGPRARAQRWYSHADRTLSDAPIYPPDLLTDVNLLDEIFELQSQRAFALMRQLGVPIPERDPKARRRWGPL